MMKVRMIADLGEGTEFVTVGKVYDCKRVSTQGTAYISDNEGMTSELYKGEWEMVDE
jgi:hypothetical protein